MGFFKKFQLGKVLGATARGFAQGGIAGAAAQGSAAALQASFGAATSRASRVTPYGSSAQYGGLQTNFGGAYQLPGTLRVSNYEEPGYGMTVADVPMVTKDIFDLAIRILDRLGIRVKRPSSVIPLLRSALAKLLRFARATPGLTIISLLINLGLTANEAEHLLTWYTTKGKKRRRIRVTNVKALRRSVRRLEGFRKLAHRVEVTLGRRGAVVARRRTIGRCRVCRKNPCCC